MRQPQLCVTVAAPTMEELRRGRDAASEADLVELRLDAVDRPDVAGALQGRRTPVIVTCRAAWERGGFKGSEDERRRIFESAIEQGAEFVDVEAAAAFLPDIVRARAGKGIIASAHNYGEPPADLPARFAALRATGAEIAKLAIEVDRLDQMLPLFDLAGSATAVAKAVANDDARGQVLIAMGSAGLPSRVLAARLKSRWTYAGDGVAPGQIPASRLIHDFRFRRISSDAALYGVVGNPIGHSLSPVMHNAGFASLGLNAAYVPLQARDAEDFVRFAKHCGLRGVSITAPFKVSLMPYADDIDPLARRVGAINTLVVRDGKWIGANTDVDGFLSPLTNRIHLRGARATILGAGGAARAVAVALADQGASVTICARQRDRANAIADAVHGTVGEFPPRGTTWDVLVNATTMGSLGNPGNPMADVDLDGEIVFDLVYAPRETALLSQARAEGCLPIGGLEMLIAQAERQFELWTGQRPPSGLFEAAVGEPARAGVTS